MSKWFTEKNYLKLIIVPMILLVLFIVLIFIAPGIKKGIDLKGGYQIIVNYDDQKDYSNLESKLTTIYNLPEIHVSETKGLNGYGLLIEFGEPNIIEDAKQKRSGLNYTGNLDALKIQVTTILEPLKEIGYLSESDLSEISIATDADDLKLYLNDKLMTAGNNFNTQVMSLIKTELSLGNDAKIQIREVSPTLGNDFVKTSVKVGITAFILLAIVILLFFKEIMPSLLIIFSAIFDMFAGLAGMALFNLPLSLVTIPALLMLIGYSVDTDILLTTRVLKDHKKDPFEAANDSVKTGLTMTFGAIATVAVMLIIAYFTQMLVVLEIATILLFGLMGDIFGTWFFNAPTLIKYTISKEKKKN